MRHSRQQKKLLLLFIDPSVFPLKWTDIDAGTIFKLSKTISPHYNTIFFLKSYTPCILYLFVTHSFYPQERNTGVKGKKYC